MSIEPKVTTTSIEVTPEMRLLRRFGDLIADWMTENGYDFWEIGKIASRSGHVTVTEFEKEQRAAFALGKLGAPAPPQGLPSVEELHEIFNAATKEEKLSNPVGMYQKGWTAVRQAMLHAMPASICELWKSRAEKAEEANAYNFECNERHTAKLNTQINSLCSTNATLTAQLEDVRKELGGYKRSELELKEQLMEANVGNVSRATYEREVGYRETLFEEGEELRKQLAEVTRERDDALRCPNCGRVNPKGVCDCLLDKPAPEPEKWAAEKAAHKAGKVVQSRIKATSPGEFSWGDVTYFPVHWDNPLFEFRIKPEPTEREAFEKWWHNDRPAFFEDKKDAARSAWLAAKQEGAGS